MAKTSSRPNSAYSQDGDTVRFGSGRWRNNNRVSGIRFKICICGKVNVGKTSIFLRLKGEDFYETKPVCQTTTFEFVDEDDKTVEYSIWDTPDCDALSLGDHFRNAHCIILVYDASDFESLEYLEYELANLEKCHYASDAKFILVQNKIDKKPSKHVSINKQRDFIAKSRLRSKVDLFCKTSAKLNEGITELFKVHLKQVLAMPTEEVASLECDFNDKVDGQKKKKSIKCRTM